MKNTEENPLNCENLVWLCRDLEEFWTNTKQAILDYRHRLWDCFCECNGLRKECQNVILYFRGKTSAIIEDVCTKK